MKPDFTKCISSPDSARGEIQEMRGFTDKVCVSVLDRRDTYSKSQKSRLESPLKWTIITTPHQVQPLSQSQPPAALCPKNLHLILFYFFNSLTHLHFHSPLESRLSHRSKFL